MKRQLIVASLAGMLSMTAFAGETVSIPFNDLDVDKNDALSAAEVSALPGMTEQWSSLDADQDGQLNRGEYTGYSAPAPAAGTDTAK